MTDANNNTVLPFTRGLIGMGDYTVCYFDERFKTTHGHQLALSVVIYSLLQTLFWYDAAADYQNEPEIAFFADVPTVWDDTKVLSGDIGAFITVARRSGSEWFLGSITNTKARTVSINFDFLESGKMYLATIYSDDPNLAKKTQVAVEKMGGPQQYIGDCSASFGWYSDETDTAVMFLRR